MDDTEKEVFAKSSYWSFRDGFPVGKPSDLDLASYVLSGRVEHVPPRKSKVVKIFISSTFTDMYAERNYLMMNVYPRLQKYCLLNYNLEFQTVDMRWGVRDEAVKDHSGPKICMDELNSCQESSLGPNFVCLLGQRYGSRPLQAEIVKTEFDAIVEALQSMNAVPDADVDVSTLLDWYKCDSNGIPEVVILTPLNERDPEVNPKDFNAIAKVLTASLRCGAIKAFQDGKITEEDSMKYMWSVTEEEIYRGILSKDGIEAGEQALFFQRVFTNINFEFKKVNRFIDMMPNDGKGVIPDPEAKRLMDSLIDRTKKKLPLENCHVETVDWSVRGEIDEDNLTQLLKDSTPGPQNLSAYLKRFGDNFEEKVRALIDKAVRKRDPLRRHRYSQLLIEICEHDNQANDKIKTFQGRDDLLSKIEQYITSTSYLPFVVHGKSGFGKTSLLAVASRKVYDWLGDTPELVVVRRFLGTTPYSTNIGSLLESICLQITQAFRYKVLHSSDPLQKLNETIRMLPIGARLVIFLDSLDQLSTFGNAHQLMWLPFVLPANVKLVVSLIPSDEQQKLLDTLEERRYPNAQYAEVNILETELALKLISDWLTSCGRQLTQEQMFKVERRFTLDQNTSPLYIKLIFDVVMKVRSYMNVDELENLLNSINTVVSCIRYINMELMSKIGPLLVHRIFAYLHLSNLGLTENELVDLISMDDEVLNDVFQFSAPPIRRLPAAIWARIKNSVKEYIVTREANGGEVIAWYHRQFVEVGDELYKEDFPLGYNDIAPDTIKTPEDLCNILRENMVDYFMGKWANGVEKPFIYSEMLAKKKKLEDRNSKADRFLPSMPNFLENRQPNMRKMGQLPLLLIKLDRVNEFIREVFGNIEALVGLFHMYSWSHIYELITSVQLENYKAIGKDKNEEVDDSAIKIPFNLLTDSLKLTSVLGRLYPDMLGTLIQGRLLPFAAGADLIRDFVNNIYEKGTKFNALACPHTQLEGVGGLLDFEIPNDHDGPCVDIIAAEAEGGDLLFTISRKAILLNLDNYEIVMRFQPPDMLKNDSFHLARSTDPFKQPREVVACLRIQPKIYVFSVAKYNLSGTIDCRDVKGCETMRIQELVVFKDDDDDVESFIAVSGKADEGVLIYSVSSTHPLYRYFDKRPVITMCRVTDYENASLAIIQYDKMTVVEYFDDEDDDESVALPPENHIAPTEPSVESKKSTFKIVKQEKIILPGDSIVTASHITDDVFIVGTEDGHLYVGGINIVDSRSQSACICRVLLSEPAHYISTSLEGFDGEIAVCTKNYAYFLKSNQLECAFPHKIRDTVSSFQLEIRAKIDLPLSKIYLVSQKVLLGFHLGQVYFISHEKEEQERKSIFVFRTFDAHPQPLTGMMLNTVATSDGTVRVFEIGKSIHPFIIESFSFDRMTVPIHKLAGSDTMSVSLSSESTSVVIWSQKTGRILGKLDHSLPVAVQLTDIWCFQETVVTLTTAGVLSFWAVDAADVVGRDLMNEISFEELEQITYGNRDNNELIIRCKGTWYRYDALIGQKIEMRRYDDRDLLKHHYVNGQLSLLQVSDELGEYQVEIYARDTSSLVPLKGNGLPDDANHLLVDFFCSDKVLILLYTTQFVFYNWKNNQVLDSIPVKKASLITNQSNSFILVTNQEITVYRIKQGVERLGSRGLQHKSDRVKITPDGRYLVVVEGLKMIYLYRIEELSSPIGSYSCYGDIDSFDFTCDSVYLILAIADTRMFFLLLCDEKNPEHKTRVSFLIKEDFSEEEVKRATEMIENMNNEIDDIDDEIDAAMFTADQINLCNYVSPAEWFLLKIDHTSLTRNLIQGMADQRISVPPAH